MNMEAPIVASTSPAHLTAFAEVDAWRGRCVRHFARLEQAIARFLADHNVETPVVGIGLGCRMKQLAAFLETTPATKNAALRKAVRALEPARARREAIVHGDGTIYLSQQGHWLWDCAFLRTKDQAPTAELFRQEEAQSFERQLKAQVQSLCDRLANFELP